MDGCPLVLNKLNDKDRCMWRHNILLQALLNAIFHNNKCCEKLQQNEKISMGSLLQQTAGQLLLAGQLPPDSPEMSLQCESALCQRNAHVFQCKQIQWGKSCWTASFLGMHNI